MSVAFRRESDDEHLEPKFELPIPPGPNRVTPRGLALIAERLAACEAQVAELVAASPQDEAAIKAARRDLRYWSTRAATAEVPPAPDGQVVSFGCTVTFDHNGRRRSVTLVGDDEADPAQGLISFTAPLARALMGAEAGEMLPFGGHEDAIEVIAIAAGF